ncbi:putative ATPase domain protein [Caulobacter phage CcrColossus]|uniref:Putative ATPase domain protein n=1 Tax=Caulobacter phage CcrColossus TaxID=1211640 RepID=K4JRZ2_9CAUD|nr:putative ATPase domain protein [Caulobacter phage CcrColossus]AFU88114.1 putative ATPase domain protein [Caulobacter phage CcrColossus]
MTKKSRYIAPTLAKDVLENSRFFGSDSVFNGKLFEGDERLVVIVGENASGKSLLFRSMAAWVKKDYKVTGITISIRERTDSTVPFRRSFMFGEESEKSTGANSFQVIEAGLRNAEGGGHGQTLLMLDEPEIGLSDGYARALGEYLGQRALTLTDACQGLVVVTHSHSLVRGAVEGLKTAPTFVHVGSQPKPLDEWLGTTEYRTVEDLSKLGDLALERWRAIQKLMKD